MKKFLLNLLLFLLLFFIAEKGVYYFINEAPKKEYDKRLEKVLKGEMNKDLIILGSSRGASNIIAGQIEKETGYSAYNLSYPGSSVLFHKFILKALLDHNKAPEKIILAIDNPYQFVEESTLNFRFDRLYPLAKYGYINEELIKQGEKSVLSKWFCLARINNYNFFGKRKEASIYNPMDSSGTRSFISRKLSFVDEYNQKTIDYDVKLELIEKLKAFKEIQQLCLTKNVELTFVFSPDYKMFNYSFKKRFDKLMLPENKMIIYNKQNPIYKDKAYFYDASHLMQAGASIFTSEISAFINNASAVY